ncbi:aromatic ring-hydroxylating dioxygenase subunit alpha [Sporichthya sp.]|uniref:aromatic ring-hydroxylating oxygenase subunit alpha n=1 Tax=Sporichthya sp. TaxID=65475 RepID=UPI001844C660|nr:aromatic ring-hydroxylating dioxygenase subunit alpha [Sporichthya sp.]MBA3743289.1 aromatic ring-hydroxylating dioxygenase subunit alpha [Sporichthya sp.]
MTMVAQPDTDPTLGNARHASEIQLTDEQRRITTDRYTKPEVLRAEIEKVWLNVWQMACREDDVANPGDFFEYAIGPKSFLIVRGEDGVVRGFHNVCRHRGNVLKEGAGNCAGKIVCGFHFWAYGLDGELTNVPDAEVFGDVDRAKLSLTKIAVDVWGGWVFIHPNAEKAEPLLEFLSPLPERITGYHLDKLVPVGLNVRTPSSCNWKVAVEAFLELYHLPAVHPQVISMVDDRNPLFEEFDTHNLMIIPMATPSPKLGESFPVEETLRNYFGVPDGALDRPDDERNLDRAAVVDKSDKRSKGGVANGDYFMPSDLSNPIAIFDQFRDADGNLDITNAELKIVLARFFRGVAEAKGVDFSSLTDRQMVDDWHYFIFPNVVINVTAASFLMYRFTPDWSDPNKCIVELVSYEWVLDPEQASAVRAPVRAFGELEESLGLLMDQDFYQMPRVHKGMQSGSIDELILGNQEVRIAHFHSVLNRYLTA